MERPGPSNDRATTPARSLNAPALWALSILVGVVAGLGAVAFRALIGFVHNLLFLGKLSSAYDANTHTPPSPWGPFVIFVPVAGALGVAFLVKNFAPEAKGHGVPEVMDAVYHRRGIIRPVVSVVKALASALSIGSGASIGREGPIIQIGSSFGSTLGQLLSLPAWQRITLIAAGAGGGIGATFNTPVGGVLFAVEIILHEVSARTLVPVFTATATATYVGQLFFGPHPSFSIPALETPFFVVAKPVVLVAYAGLGAIAGLVSALFIRSIYGCEEFFEKHVKGGYYVQHMAGMLVVGSLMYAMMRRFGHYYIQGVGYATIQDVLTGLRYPLYLLLLLFAAKLLATSLTLGSGASGGVFSPALFLGATSGAAWGVVLNHFFPALQISPAAFAVAGMGGCGGRRHRRRDGGNRHDFRNDARLHGDHSYDIDRRHQLWGAQEPDQGQHLYAQAHPAWGVRPRHDARRCSTRRGRGAHHASGQSGSTRCIGGGQRRRLSRRLRHGGRRRFFMGRRRQDAGHTTPRSRWLHRRMDNSPRPTCKG